MRPPRIVLVEDDDWKRDQLIALIREEFPGVELHTARSVNGGLRAVRAGADLVVLDISLPSFEDVAASGGRPQGFGGREILAQMRLRGIQTPVVVVTQYGEFDEGGRIRSLSDVEGDLQRAAPDNYHGVVLFSAAVTGWQSALRAKLRETLSIL